MRSLSLLRSTLAPWSNGFYAPKFIAISFIFLLLVSINYFAFCDSDVSSDVARCAVRKQMSARLLCSH